MFDALNIREESQNIEEFKTVKQKYEFGGLNINKIYNMNLKQF